MSDRADTAARDFARVLAEIAVDPRVPLSLLVLAENALERWPEYDPEKETEKP